MDGIFVSEDGIGVDRFGEYFDLTPEQLRAHGAAILAVADEMKARGLSALHLRATDL
jgi:hypothetical protein